MHALTIAASSTLSSLTSSALEDGVWVDPSAAVHESRPLDGIRLFRLSGRHTVALIATPPEWHHSAQRLKRQCVHWEPIHPFIADVQSTRPPNAFSCLYSSHVTASAALDDFNARFSGALSAAFNISAPHAASGAQTPDDPTACLPLSHARAPC